MRVTLQVVGGPHKGKSFAFSEHENFIVGRGSQAHFQLPQDDPHFSRLHFLLEINPPLCRLMDMHSANGTFVNKERVSTIDLKHGDLIRGGNTLIRVGIESPPATIPTPTMSLAAPDLWATVVPGPSAEQRGAEQTATTTAPAFGADAAIARTVLFDVDSVSGEDGPDNADLRTHIPATMPSSSGDRGSGDRDNADRTRTNSQLFPGYRIVREIGRGGMGVVYQAVCTRDGSIVALKTIRPASAGSGAETERFLREAEILKSLRHPHIVAFRDMGATDENLFFAMDFVVGADLSRLLAQAEKPLSIRRSVKLILQLLSALHFAHESGFVHRDIKPGNLLVGTEEGREFLRVTDFGLARTYQSSRLGGLTMTGDLGGTAPYMAPEQIVNFRDAKPAVDQYAAAATLYFALTRRHIYDFPPNLTEQILLILQSEPVPIRKRRADIPETLAECIHRALSRDPADRFPDVRAFRDALRAVFA